MVLKQNNFIIIIYSSTGSNPHAMLFSELCHITVLYIQSHAGGAEKLKLGQSGWKISPRLKKKYG